MYKRKSEPAGTPGRAKQMKFDNLMEGKRTLDDNTLFLKEVLTITESGNAQDLAELPAKIQLLLKGAEKASKHLDEVLKLDGNLRLAKDLISSNKADENQLLTVQSRLQQNSGTATTQPKKSLLQQRIENATKDIEFPPSSAKKKKIPISEEELQGRVAELEKYQAPGVDGSRYCIRQLLTLLKIDRDSPIYQQNVLNVVAALNAAGKCVVNYHTLRRRVRIYNEKQILPKEGDEGTLIGRPPLPLPNGTKLVD